MRSPRLVGYRALGARPRARAARRSSSAPVEPIAAKPSVNSSTHPRELVIWYENLWRPPRAWIIPLRRFMTCEHSAASGRNHDSQRLVHASLFVGRSGGTRADFDAAVAAGWEGRGRPCKNRGQILYWAAQASCSHRSGDTRRATTHQPAINTLTKAGCPHQVFNQ